MANRWRAKDFKRASEKRVESTTPNEAVYWPEGPYTLPLWNQVPKDHPYNGFEGPNSIIVVPMDPLGWRIYLPIQFWSPFYNFNTWYIYRLIYTKTFSNYGGPLLRRRRLSRKLDCRVFTLHLSSSCIFQSLPITPKP